MNNTTTDTGTHTPDDATRILKNLDALYESEIEDEIAAMTPEELDDEVQRIGVNIPALTAKIFGTASPNVAALIANMDEMKRIYDKQRLIYKKGSPLDRFFEGLTDGITIASQDWHQLVHHLSAEVEVFQQKVAKLKADDEIARQNAEGSTLALYYEGKIDAYEAVLRIFNPTEAPINVEKNEKE